MLPQTAVVQVKPGDVVVCGQPMGDLVPRLDRLEWDAVSKLLGNHTKDVVAEFLLAVAEPSPNHPGNYLVPQRFIAGTESLANRTRKGTVRWLLDLSAMMEYLVGDLNALVLPPIRYAETELCFGSMTVHHQQAVSNKEGERTRNYYRNQRNARSTAVVGTEATA